MGENSGIQWSTRGSSACASTVSAAAPSPKCSPWLSIVDSRPAGDVDRRCRLVLPSESTPEPLPSELRRTGEGFGFSAFRELAPRAFRTGSGCRVSWCSQSTTGRSTLRGAERNPKRHHPTSKPPGSLRSRRRRRRDRRSHGSADRRSRRIEALRALQRSGAAAPRGVEVRDGAWLVPILTGYASKDAREAGLCSR